MSKFLKLISIILITGVVTSAVAQNTLSKAEKKEGWKLIFDGKTTDGWRKYNSDKISPAWKVKDGALYLDVAAKKESGGGDIITNDEFENYELRFEWKIQKCGNSGVIFNVVESDQYKATWFTGPEMQVLDNTCHPDAKIVKHKAGDLYDLIECNEITVKPAGEWNEARIHTNKGKYSFWLNGKKVVEFTMHTPEWNKLVAESKFKDLPAFGKATKGRIALQDHGDEVWFRNMKIKELK